MFHPIAKSVGPNSLAMPFQCTVEGYGTRAFGDECQKTCSPQAMGNPRGGIDEDLNDKCHANSAAADRRVAKPTRKNTEKMCSASVASTAARAAGMSGRALSSTAA
jgi:hypothetical protein